MILKAAPVLIAALSSLGCAPLSFDEAKEDPSKRMAWLARTLDTLLVSGWYYLPDAGQQQSGLAALKEAYEKDGRAVYFKKELPGLLAPLQSPVLSALPYYREKEIAGEAGRTGRLLVGNLFDLACEDEARSVLEDYAGTVIDIRRNNLKAGGRGLDGGHGSIREVSHRSLIKLWAQSVQLENILRGKRNVSDGFRQEVVKQYLAALKALLLQLRKEHAIYDDTDAQRIRTADVRQKEALLRLNAIQKEVTDTLDAVFDVLKERIRSAGYEHLPVDTERKIPAEYALKKA